VSVENRLTADQLAGLSPGDTVCIETASGTTRPRFVTGTVVNVGPFEVFVSSKGPGGGKFVERFSRRNGLRTSGGKGGAELVNAVPADSATVERRREVQQLDALWLTWRRNRGDVDVLQQLHEAIGLYLVEQSRV
jgi:hypothetical protein